MKAIFGRYFLWLSLVMAILQAGTLGLLKLLPTLELTPIVCSVFITVFYVIAAASGYLTIKSGEKRPQALVRAVMSSTVIKFFLYMIALAVIILTTDIDKREIAFMFFILYFIFTVFEKAYVLKSLKNSNLSNSDTTS